MEDVMKKLVTIMLAFFLGLGTVAAQVTLDPQQFVNTQIAADTLADGTHDPAKTVYTAASGTYYAFDGTLECNFDLTILGPDDTWILKQTNPPVFFQTPAAAGTARDMINLREGGSVTLKNILLTGLHGNDVNISSFVRNFGGYKIVWDNCAFSDHRDHCTRSTGPTDEITITNCVFINGDRRGGSPFGGMPFRLDAACTQLTFENNTVFNAARLFGNGGNFFTSKMTEIHNTVCNQQVNGHELHWLEGLQANNIYYNWSWRGRDLRTNHYEAPFTTWDHFYDVENQLDSLSLYEGSNAFYLDPAFPEYWNNTINPLRADDSAHVRQCYLWPTGVDTTITEDDNFTIGKNYWQFDPMFTNNPSKIDSMCGWDLANWTAETHYSDWRITPPITWNADGTPNLNWPPDMDLSYSNSYLQTAGTDGLPLGDLNWYPDAKATYLANRDQYIAALRDSMVNATWVYIPGDSASAVITPTMVGVEKEEIMTAAKFELDQNYPNPFNPTTSICFTVPVNGKVKLVVYNLMGQVVATLVDEYRLAGSHSVKFDAKDLPSGMYIYKLKSGDTVMSRKLMVLK
jgi:hypothetical protein